MLYYLADKWRRSRKGHSCVKVKELERYVVSVFRDVSAQSLSVRPRLLLIKYDSSQDLGVISRVVETPRRAYRSSIATRHF